MTNMMIEIGEIRQIHYGRKYVYAFKPQFQHRHCKVIGKANKGMNCLVMLKGGIKMIIPGGNLIPPYRYKQK